MKTPAKQWEIHFIPLCHHDYGYTRAIELLLSDFMGFYRDVLRFIEATVSYPDEAKFRYTCEQMWSVSYFLEHCTAEEKEQFIRYAKTGQIEISAFWGNIAEAHCSNEEIIRMMYPAFELKRRYGIPVSGGSLVDMPGQGWGIPKIMAGAGLDYFFSGMPSYFTWDNICGVHDISVVHSQWDEEKVLPHGKPDAYWWEGQDGSRVLTYYQGSYGFFRGWRAQDIDAPETLEDVEEHLPRIIEDMENRRVQFSVLRFIDHGVDNRAPKMMICDIVRRWNEKHDNPKIRVSTNTEFFKRLAEDRCVNRENTGNLSVWRGEIPHTDYTYATMTFARESALNFCNQGAVAEAEFLTTAAWLCGVGKPCQQEISALYNDILSFNEHCYGMSSPIGPAQKYNWSSKAHHVYRAAANAAEISNKAAFAISAGIIDSEDGTPITVFNPLSFTREGPVRLADLPVNPSDSALIDCGTGEVVPHTVYTVDRHYLTDAYSAESETWYRMGEPEIEKTRYLTFLAKGVPAMGWKSYRLVPVYNKNPGAVKTTESIGSSGVIENIFYRISFEPGSGRLASIFDKELGRELIDSSSIHPFAAVICRDCRTQEEFLPQYSGLELVHSSPVMQKALVRFSVMGIPEAALSITLYEDLKRVDFELKLLFNGLPVHEWFLALPLDIKDPLFEYEGTQCRPTPFRDQFPGSNTNYFCVRSWASSADSGMKAVISSIEAHTVFFGGLWPNYVSQAHHAVHPIDFGKPYVTRGEIKKGGMYLLLAFNNARTNFHMTQNGEVRYKLALTTGKPEASPTRFGWGFQNKFIGICAAKAPGCIPTNLEQSRSLVETSVDNVQILTIKSAEDGKGLIVRVMETEGLSGDVRITLQGLEIRGLKETNLVEEDKGPVNFSGCSFIITMKSYETRTFRIFFT